MCSAMSDGTLLKPSWPATPIDAYFSFRAFGRAQDGPDGEVYATYTTLEGAEDANETTSEATRSPLVQAYTVVHIMAIDLKSAYTVQLAQLTGQIPSLSPKDAHFLWAADTYSCSHSLPEDVRVRQGASGIGLAPCAKADFQVVHAAQPVICSAQVSLGLLGETGKWVPVSAQRFRNVRCTPSSELAVTVRGSPGEVVAVRFAKRMIHSGEDAKVISASCIMGTSGEATAASDGTCVAL